MSDEWYEEHYYTMPVEKRDKTKFESKASIIIAALSFGIHFSLFFGSWALYFCMGPLLWIIAIIFGIIAILKEDNYGYYGVGLAYLSFLVNVSILIH